MYTNYPWWEAGMLRELWFNLLFDIYILYQCIFAYRGGGGVEVNNFFQNVCSILPTNLWKFTNEILIETCWLIHLMTFNRSFVSWLYNSTDFGPLSIFPNCWVCLCSIQLCSIHNFFWIHTCTVYMYWIFLRLWLWNQTNYRQVTSNIYI